MNKDAKIYIAGHTGLVGSAIEKSLRKNGYENIVVRNSSDLDLRRQQDTEFFFSQEKPEYVFLCAAKVGGIWANNIFPAEFIYDNIAISSNCIHSAWKFGVKKLMNLGSSCIYPKYAPQPLREDYLLTGSLESTNEPYAVAKIAALKLCWSYFRQYGAEYISLMPCNLYGIGDNFNIETAHVLPALMRKIYLAKQLKEHNYENIRQNIRNCPIGFNVPVEYVENDDIDETLINIGISPDRVTLWGSGTPRREFLSSTELASVAVFMMEKHSPRQIGEFVNIGAGTDVSILELAELLKEILAWNGEFVFDNSKPDGTMKKLMDVSRAESLGWKSTQSLREGITEMWQWYSSQQKYFVTNK